jgi:hypothetical protein
MFPRGLFHRRDKPVQKSVPGEDFFNGLDLPVYDFQQGFDLIQLVSIFKNKLCACKDAQPKTPCTQVKNCHLNYPCSGIKAPLGTLSKNEADSHKTSSNEHRTIGESMIHFSCLLNDFFREILFRLYKKTSQVVWYTFLLTQIYTSVLNLEDAFRGGVRGQPSGIVDIISPEVQWVF